MLRSILLASTFAVALTGTAFAQGASNGGPRMVGGGPDAQVVYMTRRAPMSSAAVPTIIGGARDQRLAYGGTPTTLAPSGLVGEITGEAGNRHVTYHQASPTGAGLLAGRPPAPAAERCAAPAAERCAAPAAERCAAPAAQRCAARLLNGAPHRCSTVRRTG